MNLPAIFGNRNNEGILKNPGDKFEARIRNIMAHQIRKMDKKFIEEQGGRKLENVMTTLFELNGVEPGLYDRINELILNEI